MPVSGAFTKQVNIDPSERTADYDIYSYTSQRIIWLIAIALGDGQVLTWAANWEDLYSGLSDNTSVCTNLQHTHSLCLPQSSQPAIMVLPANITTTILHCRQIWPRLPCWQSTNSSRRVAHKTSIRQHGKMDVIS